MDIISMCEAVRLILQIYNIHMKRVTLFVISLFLTLTAVAHAVPKFVTVEEFDTIREKLDVLSRINLGGFGEGTFNYDFSSVRSYVGESDIEDAPSHYSFDIPRIVLMLEVNLGKGWGIETDIQFENLNKVGIDQFWIQKQLSIAAGFRVGYFTLPVGEMNAHDDPLEFFTVNRPEGEDEILPCEWHQTGVSFFGEKGPWSYDFMVLPGLNTSLFSKSNIVYTDKDGELLSVAKGRDFAITGRLDNTSIAGLRLTASGYWGLSSNTRLEYGNGINSEVKGNIGVLSFDFLYDNYGLVVRGNTTWGRYSKSTVTTHSESNFSDKYSGFKNAVSVGLEGGYNVFNLFPDVKEQKLYVFGRYDYWQPYTEIDKTSLILSYRDPSSVLGYDWGKAQKLTVGINYFPIDNVVIKADFSQRFEANCKRGPMVSLGVGYSGQFL